MNKRHTAPELGPLGKFLIVAIYLAAIPAVPIFLALLDTLR